MNIAQQVEFTEYKTLVDNLLGKMVGLEARLEALEVDPETEEATSTGVKKPATKQGGKSGKPA